MQLQTFLDLSFYVAILCLSISVIHYAKNRIGRWIDSYIANLIVYEGILIIIACLSQILKIMLRD